MKDTAQILESIRPTLESLEPGRHFYHKRKWIYLTLLFVPLAGILSLFFFVDSPVFVGIGAAIWFIIGIVLYQIRAGSVARAFKSKYKNTVVPPLLNTIDSQLGYEPEGGIGSGVFVDSELYKTQPDRYSTEDLIRGRYGETSLMLAEIHAEDRQTTTDSEGRTRTRYVTIFKGLMLVADFHKHFQGRTFVFPDKAEKLFGGVGRFFQKLSGRKSTDLIQLEDPEFEKAFAVHATDEIEARYILSTSMMRRLLDMKSRFGDDVRVGFKNSSVYLAVPHREAFLEPKLGTEATDPEQVEQFLGQLRYFLDTIEELNLNTRIWSKE